jgi:peptide/nickel transport system substrate-binding protein
LKIREGIRFTNGEEVDADAVVFSLNEWFASEHWNHVTFNFDKAEKVDDYTVRVLHKEVFAPTLNLARLAQASWVVPPKYYQEVGGDEFGTEPIGTGPFVLKEWVKDDHLTFEANPDYQETMGPAPEFKTLVFRPIPEPAARVAALEAGDVDIIFDVPYGAIPRLEQNPDIQVYEVPGLRVMGVQMDMRYGLSDITANQKVRQAFLYAIDRQAIIDSVFEGHATQLTQIATPGDFGYVEELEPFPYDPERAKQLLAEAGYPDGFEITFMCPSGRYIRDKEVCQAIAAQLERIGVTSQLQFLEVGDFFDKALTGKLGPISYIGTLVETGHVADRMNANSCRYNASFKCEDDYEALLERAERTLDPDEQKQLLEELIRLDLENPGRIPLWVTNDVWATRGRVNNWEPTPNQEVWFFGVGVEE